MLTCCLVCQKIQAMPIQEKFKTKTGRLQIKSVCKICSNNKTRVISGSGLFDMLGLNTPENRRKKAILSRYGY